MSTLGKLAVLGFLAVALLWVENADAQSFNPRSANVGQATMNYLLNRPTVSPYLNLLRTESEITLPNYHTLVRPQLEGRQDVEKQQVAIRQLQSHVSSIQGRMARERNEFGTGHPTRFMTYLHYYPALGSR